ncbi:hypothetical protein [Collimonas sp. OK242]|uniref:hypothetical protein n=1 Tax=Collimonas sp. OK242 TaxID=1798195 RepID=UPI00115FE6D9|nr:hypothetical protein [Collimonas sp. OK242]
MTQPSKPIASTPSNLALSPGFLRLRPAPISSMPAVFFRENRMPMRTYLAISSETGVAARTTKRVIDRYAVWHRGSTQMDVRRGA